MLIVKKYHNNSRWNSLIFSVQKIWSPSFLFVKSLNSVRTTFFLLDDSLSLSYISQSQIATSIDYVSLTIQIKHQLFVYTQIAKQFYF